MCFREHLVRHLRIAESDWGVTEQNRVITVRIQEMLKAKRVK